MTPEEELKSDDAIILLSRIARELTTIRQLASDAVNYMRNAEVEIPEMMRRFMNYAHDVHDVKYMYQDLGQPVPDHLLRELERIDDRYRQLLDEMNAEGGAFNKVRRKMAEDPLNRWDHTRQLTHRKEAR